MRYSGRLFYFCGMNTLLFDHPKIRRSLMPLTFTRPIADLRLGIMTIAEKWAHDLQVKSGYLTEGYLLEKHPPQFTEDNHYINGAVCPNEALVKAVKALSPGEGLEREGILIAGRGAPLNENQKLTPQAFQCKPYNDTLVLLRQTWELFLENGDQIEADFRRVTAHRQSAVLDDPHTVVYNPENLFIEPGASIKAAIINAESGPVYIGKDTEVQEGTIIQGPFALCDHAQLRLGGKMRPNTTIGPWSKVGGEVGNVVFQSHSNKAHEGFLGNSFIGSWCNLGADTNNSNLKNNYASVHVWSYLDQKPIDSGLQFCGTIMGDHSKCSINTMFNTGTVVGVSANIFGAGFPPKFIPCYTWGGVSGMDVYDFDKSCETVARVMARKSLPFDEVEQRILRSVFQETEIYRQPAKT